MHSSKTSTYALNLDNNVTYGPVTAKTILQVKFFKNHFFAISHSMVSGLHGNARKKHLEAPHSDYSAEYITVT